MTSNSKKFQKYLKRDYDEKCLKRNHDLIEVEWWDHTRSQGGWVSKNHGEQISPGLIRQVGYITSEDDTCVKLATVLDIPMKDNYENHDYGHCATIIKSCITSRKTLVPKDG